MEYLSIVTKIVLVLSLGWYLITNLQWYNYKLSRVIFKHHKWQWHLTFFISPIVLFFIIPSPYFDIYFFVLYFVSFILWNRKLDRSLVLTSRVKRFLTILLITLFVQISLCLDDDFCSKVTLFLTLIVTLILSNIIEKILFLLFKSRAKKRLLENKDLKIVAITASYGKTSIKNFLHHVLKNHFKTYKTPRSVNTIVGLVLDVNRDLPKDTQIYIAEAGARVKGDIKTIANFLEPQIAVVGSVGEQHIEYFKTLENIKNTKKELLLSPRLQKAFVHSSANVVPSEKIEEFPNNLHIVKSNLDGLWFDMELNGKVEHFYAPILGSFNAINLAAVVLVATHLGMSVLEINEALTTLPQVEHRLQKIEANGKIIIDDSFNGNLEGMLEAINISSNYNGRKVIITPGLVESTDSANILLAKEIDKVFDFVIITGTLNANILKANINEDKVFVLKDKTMLETTLARTTKSGDLILFANDAPNFI
ncbi:Mur ligase family protein [Aliarcobacter cryaerophilus]|jgi:UDP-N-acetylmuramoyl-tripeptide--D-alanyl-D-alanine ligase|uniref:Mur ligase family protein n=3 Tax=Arcobacteraceae TaxID=2808963 RepID=A0AAU0P043_9BACT|nr:UDP-N-acetylmuramoyl-tripeptide--D-alanyl-D-alanine ligase [Aliarcobacter cryaerophilus]MCT7473420.1 Mur ligase family protein [Aliarcobacter cryaerophilus]MCT7514836.1 Mur ligase family protein [Aliarcobacter cryaerophilus]UYF43886.1 Mur ligase family protein [Aliarcobacter cryaerophilus]WPD02420.1 Mur ligase family protein [Arcobacter sp. DSM 115972]